MPTERGRLWLWLGAAMIGCVTDASAQERPGSLYVMGGITLPSQSGPSGGSRVTYTAAPGGTTFGWAVGGGVRVTREISVDAEWSTTDWMTAREVSRHGLTGQRRASRPFRSDRRATLSFRPTSRFDIEPVIGVAVTSPEGRSQAEYGNVIDPAQPPVIAPIRQVPLDTSAGPLFGFDVRLGTDRGSWCRRFARLCPRYRPIRVI